MNKQQEKERLMQELENCEEVLFNPLNDKSFTLQWDKEYGFFSSVDLDIEEINFEYELYEIFDSPLIGFSHEKEGDVFICFSTLLVAESFGVDMYQDLEKEGFIGLTIPNIPYAKWYVEHNPMDNIWETTHGNAENVGKMLSYYSKKLDNGMKINDFTEEHFNEALIEAYGQELQGIEKA